MAKNEINVEKLSYKYTTRWVIKGFSHIFKEDYLYFLTAPNGKGKTTLLRILAGELTPLQGKITMKINGDKVPYDKFYTKVSFQTPTMQIPEDLLVREIINYYNNTGNLISSFKEFINYWKLEQYVNFKIKELSSGTQQRLLLGLTTFTYKPILIYDEPTANLDHENAKMFVKSLRENSSDKIIIIASNLKRELELLRSEFNNIKVFSI